MAAGSYLFYQAATDKFVKKLIRIDQQRKEELHALASRAMSDNYIDHKKDSTEDRAALRVLRAKFNESLGDSQS
jgi:radical SAM superfamily enzyme